MKSTQLTAETGTHAEQSPLDGDESLPSDLQSPRAKLVYLYLRQMEEGTVEHLRTALGMKTITLYPVLGTLVEKGHVRSDGDRYVCR
ncbi:TrmB family transcriptional regulator [Halopelagius fulvigenes]|uniref:TrmB family transcriptional regulator n=1 Tax=Halopelagius fulvigenes TaxID=1198324 RepID=A0ABD5TSF9_9EURY